MSNRSKLFGLVALFSVSGCAAVTAAPKLDYSDVGAYMRALQQSNDPEAKTILKQIEDGPADLERERKLTQNAGIPLVTPKSNISDDQNAAPLYRRWREMWRQSGVSLPNYAEAFNSRYQYTHAQIAHVQKIFDDNHTILDVLHQAVAKPGLDFDEDTKGLFPTAYMREAAREIKMESFLLAHNGQYEDAIDHSVLGFRIATQMASQHTPLTYMVGSAMENISLSGMKDILYLAGPNEDIDNSVGATILSDRPKLSLKDGLAGDITAAIKDADALRTASPDDIASIFSAEQHATTKAQQGRTYTPEEREFVGKVIDANEARYLAGMRAIVESADLPTTQRRTRFAQLAAAYQLPQDNPLKVMPSTALSWLTETGKSDDMLHANEEVTMAAAAILAAKAKNGEFPATLPGTYIDPFTGKPLGYRKEGANGFVVYSAGINGNFDGGRAGDRPSGNAVFCYPAPIPVPKEML